MWIRKKNVVPMSTFVKQVNKSKSIENKIPEDGVNLTARLSNGHVVIEWQEKQDEQSTEAGSGSSDGNNKLADTASDDAAE